MPSQGSYDEITSHDSKGSSFFKTPELDKINGYDNIKILLTNARSLAPKIDSLLNNFDAHDLDLALVTESWLHESQVLERDIIDLEYGSDLKIIYKNRPKKPTGARRVGGGVSIIYDKLKCSFKERKIAGNNFELVLAVGKVGKIARQVAVFCLYIQPRMKAGELEKLNDILNSQILQLKSTGDPIIFVGGDLNRHTLDATDDFPDIVRRNWDPTRGDACLDVLMSNLDLSSVVVPPLFTRDGTRSDHNCVVFAGSLERPKGPCWIKRTTRKHTQKGMDGFGADLAALDWPTILEQETTVDDKVLAFQTRIRALTDRHFPTQTVKCRSNDLPWVTNGIRRLSRKKKRVYRREGKSHLWHVLQERQDKMMEDSKLEFIDEAAKGGTSTKAYFKAVKGLSCKERPPDWTVMDLYPGMTKEEAGDQVAAFFTAISDDFEPLTEQHPPDLARRAPVSLEYVKEKLKAAKKPSSEVEGDVMPRIMRVYHELFAVPAMLIFNAAFEAGKWPKGWKTETTVVIPKVNTPGSLGDCRNISCTPFLSKVLESIILDDLRREIAPDPDQYGGKKNCSVDHLLVDLFEEMLRPLDDGSPVALLSIDFEKAFNRLDHGECLEQLRELGASPSSLTMVRSFLCERSMRVKIGSTLSRPRKLKGGSPQGSILGCFLYCLTTRQLNKNLPLAAGTGGQMARASDSEVTVHVAEAVDEDQGMDLMGEGLDLDALSDSSSISGSAVDQQEEDSQGLDDAVLAGDEIGLRYLLSMFKYIDDTSILEVLDKELGIRHISASRTKEVFEPDKMKGLFLSIIRRALEIGMRVNCKKTQLLIVSPDNGCETSCTFKVDNESLESEESMKLLGYCIGSRPNADAQVELLKRKFRARFWSLIHLRRAGLTGIRLFKLYAAMVRPILETNSIIFHPMLGIGQSRTIERMQKNVVKLCFGFTATYNECLEQHNLETLEARREARIRAFVGKTIRQGGPFARKWFVPRQEVDPNIRRRRPYETRRAKTERYRRSPLLNLQRVANDMMT